MFTTPPIASLPYSVEPEPRTTSTRSIEWGATVARYWLGPYR
jgi:hypothetical protein